MFCIIATQIVAQIIGSNIIEPFRIKIITYKITIFTISPQDVFEHSSLYGLNVIHDNNGEICKII